MASRKEKHARMLEKRAAREASVREIGLKALEIDREQRKIEEARMWEDAHKIHLKRNRFHDKCEHCNKIKAGQAIEKLAKAAAKARENYTPGADGKHVGAPPVLFSHADGHQGDNTPIDLTRKTDEQIDQESADRIKGVLQEMGALSRVAVSVNG